MKFYEHITELPLRNFIDVQVDARISALAIEGMPTEDELWAAWSRIMGEYSDAIGDNEYLAYVEIVKAVATLTLKFEIVETCVEMMETIYLESYAKKVNSILNSNFKFDYKDDAAYRKDLQAALNRSRGLLLNRDKHEARLEAMKAKNEAGGKPTREYYISVLLTLSEDAHYDIPETETVFKFCTRLKRYNKKCQVNTK